MKPIFWILALGLMACGARTQTNAQVNNPVPASAPAAPAVAATPAAPKLQLYEVLPDATQKKALKGIVELRDIAEDTAFGWFAQNARYFKPDTVGTALLKSKMVGVHIVLFLGTWCEDSHVLVPQYIKYLQAAGLPQSQLTLIGTNRAKKTVGGLSEAFKVDHVPTLILMKDGKEMGRIVEYGASALVNTEMKNLIDKL